MSIIPTDLGWDYIVAIALIFLLWFGYTPIMKTFFHGSLNQRLSQVRAQWLVASLQRSQRPFDAILLGHIVGSITFFGSATMLVLAGTASLFIGVSAGHDTLVVLYQDKPPSIGLYVSCVAVLNGVLAVAFFSFIYALRKLIYVIALVGALPENVSDDKQEIARDEMIGYASIVLTGALTTFNFGIRGYYYAVAALGLFISPWASMALSLFVTGILIYRQIWSPIAKTIEAYVEAATTFNNTPKGT